MKLAIGSLIVGIIVGVIIFTRIKPKGRNERKVVVKTDESLPPTPAKKTADKLLAVASKVWKKFLALLILLLVLAFAAMFTWREGWAKTPWNWIWTHWVFSLTVIGLTIWFTLKQKGGGSSFHISSSDIKGWLNVVMMGGIIYVIFNIGGCIHHWQEEHPCPFTAPNAVAGARARAEMVTPTEQTGIRLIIAPVTNWSEKINIPTGGGKCHFPGPPTGPLWVKLKMGANERPIRVEANELEKLDAYAEQLSFRSATNYPVELWVEISK